MAEGVSRSRARDVISAEALVHVPGASLSGDDTWAMLLDGGAVNATYRVDTHAGSFVVRSYGSMSGALLADHEREAKLHEAAARAGLAPRLIHLDPQHRFLITEYVAGRMWTEADFAQESQLLRLAELLRKLHAIPPPRVAPFDLGGILQLYFNEIVRAAPEERSRLESLVSHVPDALRACGSEQRPATIMHSDLHHSNLIDGDRLLLIDWEYAAVTDPLFDLGSVLAYYPQAEPHAALLMEASGLAGQATREMLRHASWLYLLLAYLWHRYLRTASPDMDRQAEQDLLERLADTR